MKDLIITLDIKDIDAESIKQMIAESIKQMIAESIKQMIADSAAEVLIVNSKSNQDRAIILDNTKKETPKKPNLMNFYLVSCALTQTLAPTPNEKELETFRKEAEELYKALEKKTQPLLGTKPIIDETPWYDRFLKKGKRNNHRPSKSQFKKKGNKRK